MKKTLAELTAAQFVDLVCGDTSILLGKHEVPNQIALATTTRNIVIEYKSIADPGAMRAFLTHTEVSLKAQISLIVFSMCNTLIALDAIDKVKEILSEYGLSVSNMDKKRLAKEVNRHLARAKLDYERLESESSSDKMPDPSDIRRSFDKQTATMMAHFKFQIDTTMMQATLYAHLVERFSAEIKAQKDASRKK